MLERQEIEQTFHVFKAMKVLLNLQAMNPVFQVAEPHSLVNAGTLHQPMTVDQASIGAFPNR